MPSSSVNLIITNENKRKNRFISSLLLSRATIFHPTEHLTPAMQSRLINIAKNGGTDPNNPLESIYVSYFGKKWKVDLHVDYLLQPHRDILETILAYAQTIQLDDVSYCAGDKLTWSQVYNTLALDIPLDDGDTIMPKDTTILSMSMYELATRIGLAATRLNYDIIERRITQLSVAHLQINELDDSHNIIEKKPLRFIREYRLCRNSNHNISGANHVLLVPDTSLLKAIISNGYYYRSEQQKILNYSPPSLRSFIKYVMTYSARHLHNNTLDDIMTNYIQSIASTVDYNFFSDLRKELLANAEKIQNDFGLRLSPSTRGIKMSYID